MVSPNPSHEALQYLPPGSAGHEHTGFLHLSFSVSSAMFLSLCFPSRSAIELCAMVAQKMEEGKGKCSGRWLVVSGRKSEMSGKVGEGLRGKGKGRRLTPMKVVDMGIDGGHAIGKRFNTARADVWA
jgi:hypothetical protein